MKLSEQLHGAEAAVDGLLPQTSADAPRLGFGGKVKLFDQSVGGDGEGRIFAEIIADRDSENMDDKIDRTKVIGKVKECLNRLSSREEKILRLRFGIAEDLLNDSVFETYSVEGTNNGNA